MHRRRITGVGHDSLVVEFVVHIHELPLIDNLILEEAGISRILDLDLRHHLANNHLEVLVVDLHTLHAVNLLYLINDVLLDTRGTQDVQDVGRRDSTIRQRRTGLHEVVLLDDDLTRQRYQVTLHLTLFRGDDDLTITTLDLAECYLTVNLRYDGRIRRITCLEELGNTRQTSRNIATRLADSTRDLDQDIAGLDLLLVLVKL